MARCSPRAPRPRFAENSAGTFSVTATGDTPITFTETGALPTGVTLTSGGTLAGTPAFGTAGSYPITITATDTNSSTSTQAFTLTVTAGGPVFTSGASTTFSENSAGTFSVTATGDTPITFTETGALPTGVTLASGGTLAGTPAFGTAGSYPITITATDANSSTSTQAFTLTVNTGGLVHNLGRLDQLQREQRRDLLGHGHRGQPDHLHRDGCAAHGRDPDLWRHPGRHAGLRDRRQLPDHHHGHRRQLGHHDPGLHPHGDGHGPVFTSGASTTFAETSAGTFSVTATGDTPITFSETGPLPSGVTLTSGGTLAGTPASGTAGSYPITITATDANSATTTQAFTLTVSADGTGVHLGRLDHLRRDQRRDLLGHGHR